MAVGDAAVVDGAVGIGGALHRRHHHGVAVPQHPCRIREAEPAVDRGGVGLVGVVVLAEAIDHHLPVDGDGPRRRADEPPGRHAVAGQLATELGQVRVERHRARVQVQPHEAVPLGHGDAGRGHAGEQLGREQRPAGHLHDPAVEVVDEGVPRARDGAPVGLPAVRTRRARGVGTRRGTPAAARRRGGRRSRSGRSPPRRRRRAAPRPGCCGRQGTRSVPGCDAVRRRSAPDRCSAGRR